jgi:hypothetical protein
MAVRSARLVASDSVYIDPLNCDSKVSYKIIDNYKHTWGEVQLTDCDKQISWWFGTKVNLDKIDRAIEALTTFKQTLTQARLDRKTRKPRAKRASTA